MQLERLSREDAAILALEAGNVHGHMLKVLVVEGRHSLDAVREHVSRRLPAAPRLRRRLAQGVAPPAWADDEDFELARHVRERSAHGVLAAALGEIMVEALDRERPLWTLDVIALPDERRTALVWKLHHCMADGATAMRMLSAVFLDGGEEPVAATPPGGRHRARAWVPAARLAARVPGAVRRELSRSGVPGPLDRPAGPRREVAFVSAEIADLKRIEHAAPERVTVNDVVLAAVAGGLRRWLEERGAPTDGVRVKVPVCLHPGAHDGGSNRDSFIVVDLPLDAPGPLERLLEVARETRERKQQHDAQALDEFFRGLAHLSHPLERRAERMARSARVFTLNVSNVRGPAGPLRVLGSPLAALHSLAEIAHGHALRVAVVSADGRVSFGLCADPDAVPGLATIAAGIEQELGALLEGS